MLKKMRKQQWMSLLTINLAEQQLSAQDFLLVLDARWNFGSCFAAVEEKILEQKIFVFA